jgi:hypothetical protein
MLLARSLAQAEASQLTNICCAIAIGSFILKADSIPARRAESYLLLATISFEGSVVPLGTELVQQLRRISVPDNLRKRHHANEI